MNLANILREFLRTDERFLYLHPLNGEFILERKHAFIYRGKGEQLNYGYRSTKGELHSRVFTKTEQGLFIAIEENLILESFSEKMIEKSNCVTGDVHISQRLYDKVWNLPLHSKGKELYRIMTR